MLHRLISLSLRAQLLLMAFLLALPAIVLIVHSGMKERADSLQKGYREARRLVNTISREQYNLTSNVEQLLMALEHVPEIKKRDVVATNALLSAILKNSPYYANIIVTDQSGEIWASALPMSTAFSIKERLSFQQAAKTRRFSTGSYGIGKISRKPTVGFSYPIINTRGDFEGVIAANIDFAQFNDLIRGIQGAGLPKGASFSIIDRNGVIVDRSHGQEKYIGTRLRDELFLKMKNGPEKDSFIDGDASGGNWIVAYRKMLLPREDSPYLYIRSAFPLAGVMEKADRAMFVNVAVLSSVLSVVMLSVIFLGNTFFVKRLKKLQEAAQRLAGGDLEARVFDPVEKSEIGRLAQAFNGMASRLSARQAELIKSEHELSELNKNLAKRVEVETDRRLDHERLLARHARLVAMGEMIGAIAHQWRQPLATLGATIQSIRMAWEHDCIDDTFMKKAEEDAQKQLYYMSDTIEDFRDFFRPEKIAEVFDVREKIDEVMILVSPQFAHSGVLLQRIDNLPDCRLCIKGYQNEFKQALLNLVSNAFDAIIDKAIRRANASEAAEDHGTVAILVTQEDNKVVIEVQDDGCGIPPEHKDKLFDPYFTTKSGDKGTGIGLFMSKLIVEESMGGRLTFTSGPDGTVFVMELAGYDVTENEDNG